MLIFHLVALRRVDIESTHFHASSATYLRARAHRSSAAERATYAD